MITAYTLPESVAAAAAQLGDGTAVMGGGTIVMPALQAGTLRAERVIGLARTGLDEVVRTDGRTSLGATARLAAVADLGYPVLSPAARAVGGPALRNMATVGGNLLAGPPYGDVGVALLALGAEVELVGPADARRLPLADLWDSFRAGEEIIGALHFDRAPGVYLRWARRAANSPAVVCVAVSGGRVALGGVAPHPVRSPAAEAHFDDPQAAGEAAADAIDPPTDAIASAWYRRRMTRLFVRRALEEANAV